MVTLYTFCSYWLCHFVEKEVSTAIGVKHTLNFYEYCFLKWIFEHVAQEAEFICFGNILNVVRGWGAIFCPTLT